jgi:hypothetical protein
MEIGIDSFGAVISDPAAGLTLSPVRRTLDLLEEIALADKVGFDERASLRNSGEQMRC